MAILQQNKLIFLSKLFINNQTDFSPSQQRKLKQKSYFSRNLHYFHLTAHFRQKRSKRPNLLQHISKPVRIRQISQILINCQLTKLQALDEGYGTIYHLQLLRIFLRLLIQRQVKTFNQTYTQKEGLFRTIIFNYSEFFLVTTQNFF